MRAPAGSASGWRQPGFVVAEVVDDGCGGADPDLGSGLVGISDWIGAVDGTLPVTSPPGQGTTVRVEIPLGR